MISLNEYVEFNFNVLIHKFYYVLCEELNSKSNRGNAYMIFSNNKTKFRFVKDRDQMFMDFLSLYDNKNNWFSIGLIRNEILNEGDFIDLINENNICFLNEKFEIIESMFKQSNIETTIKSLKLQEKLRAKKLFG